ncbi:MAG: hypothetical protein U0271_32905 [Polyangiaceae bacterium]
MRFLSSAAPTLLVLLAFTGCSKKTAPSGASATASSTAAGSNAPTVAAAAPAVAICDRRTTDERWCVELPNDDLALDMESACAPGRFARKEACPREQIVGICQLHDGSTRFGYEPSTALQQERACKDLLGTFTTGSAMPAALRSTRVRCAGKYEGGCEEEEIYGAGRLRAAEEDCKQFGGTFASGASCDRTKALATCNLRGRRWLVLEQPTNEAARKRFCEERGGRIEESAPVAMASGSASAGPADEDAPEQKGEVTIRKE